MFQSTRCDPAAEKAACIGRCGCVERPALLEVDFVQGNVRRRDFFTELTCESLLLVIEELMSEETRESRLDSEALDRLARGGADIGADSIGCATWDVSWTGRMRSWISWDTSTNGSISLALLIFFSHLGHLTGLNVSKFSRTSVGYDVVSSEILISSSEV